MRRFLLPLFILAWSVSSALPPVMHDAGGAAGMRLHWRVKPAARDSARWGVMWNIVDSTSYEGLEIALADGRYNDAFGREEAVIKHYRVNDGHRAVLHERKLASGATMR
ncbi:MAG: hypothetical protein K2F72_02045, partial [Muribaculaceae bacterium]|nr:hypothetical protein [Muribaculaceae bacterium]